MTFAQPVHGVYKFQAMSTCPISLESIPEGADIVIDGIIFDVCSILDLILTNGSESTHPITRRKFTPEQIHSIHERARQYSATREKLQRAHVYEWSAFTEMLERRGASRHHEMEHDSIVQWMTSQWDVMIERILSDDSIIERILSDDSPIEVLMRGIASIQLLVDHATTSRIVLRIVDNAVENSTNIALISRAHDLRRVLGLLLLFTQTLPELDEPASPTAIAAPAPEALAAPTTTSTGSLWGTDAAGRTVRRSARHT
jgi:hypothetical protein